MAKKVFLYHGKTLDELKKLDLKEFIELLPSRQRRSVKRGFSDQQKTLLKNTKTDDQNLKTHCRDMVIIPEIVGKTIKIHSGKSFQQILITEEMIGHYLGEFAPTRSKVTHSAPGIGATRSSSSLSVK